MPKEPTIIDQKVVIPATREENQYGDLIFFDGDGNQHKIGNKRPQLFENIIEGRAVELYYAVYMDKKYICGAKLVEGELKPPQSDQNVLPEHQRVIDASKPDEPPAPPPAPQAVGMMTKEVGDMIRTKYLKPLFGDEAYIELIKWYRGQVLAITRISFDGAKLPTFGKPKEPETEAEDIPF